MAGGRYPIEMVRGVAVVAAPEAASPTASSHRNSSISRGPVPSIADLATLAGDANGTAIHFDAGSIRYRWLDRQRQA
jgi:hypothetical protein